MGLKNRISEDLKAAMKGGDKQRVAAIRLIQAAIKQREVDERIELDDGQVLSVLDKMIKQRRDSLEQFEKAGRDDLVAQERFELDVLQTYMPEQMGEAEIDAAVAAAIAETGAAGPRDMGRVMGALKPKLAGRADMQLVSARVKAALGG